MYIYNKPHVIPQKDGSRSSGGIMRPEQPALSQLEHSISSSSPGPSSPLPHPAHSHRNPLTPAGTASITSAPSKFLLGRSTHVRRNSLPLSFPPLFSGPANTSSTSLAASTAEGRPIPLDNTTAAHRTTALRVLNNAYPSQVNRHRSTKSTGARSATYSQPVLVRTYSGPSHSQSPYNATSHRYRPPSSTRSEFRRVPFPSFSRAGSIVSGRPVKPLPIVTRGGNPGIGDGIENGGDVTAMPRKKPTKSASRLTLSLPWRWGASSSQDPTLNNDLGSLPPIEAFSFKNMLNAEDNTGGSIGSDLDRIAEILERSKYSLSNQYEVHVAPHGSGASFVSDVASTNGARSRRRKGHGHSSSVGSGPTLQAIGSDDERRRRRGGGRRRSVAYGTLETIMSSSGSSGEAKSKKKPAAEIAAEVRGRATAKKGSNSSGGSGSASGLTSTAANCSSGTVETAHEHDNGKVDMKQSKLERKKSTSFATAVIGSHSVHRDPASPRSSTAALVSQPAQPRTSTSHIEIQTADTFEDSASSSSGSHSLRSRERRDVHLADKTEPHLEEFSRIPNGANSGGLLSSLSSWVPWKAPAGSEHLALSAQRSASSHAAGSLRQLLQTAEPPAPDKGKGVAVDPEQ